MKFFLIMYCTVLQTMFREKLDCEKHEFRNNRVAQDVESQDPLVSTRRSAFKFCFMKD